MQLQIAAKPSVICCHLANANEELGGLATAIKLFTKLLYFGFFYYNITTGTVVIIIIIIHMRSVR